MIVRTGQIGMSMDVQDVGSSVDAVAACLREDTGVTWPKSADFGDVCIERAWPLRDGRMAREWSFRVRRSDGASSPAGVRCSVYAMPLDAGADGGRVRHAHPVIGADGLRGLYVEVPAWGVCLHSPDLDPAMPHVAACLDGEVMAGHLSSLGHDAWDAAAAGGASGVSCRLLGYRAGRRAAIAYEVGRGAGASVVGKTYRSDRAARQLELHAAVRAELAFYGNGRVRVPSPIGAIPALGMGVFARSIGRPLSFWSRAAGNGARGIAAVDQARAAVDALAALHCVSVPDLDRFTIADECAVVGRWHGALRRWDVRAGDKTDFLIDALLSASESVDAGHERTVHRDFYEQQVLCSPRGTTVVDLDTLALGHPCVDLGNLLAHMFLASLRGGCGSSGFTASAQAALRRYTSHMSGPDRATLGFYWASALFRVGAVHAFRTATRGFSPAIWQLAANILAHAFSGVPVPHASFSWHGDLPVPGEILGELRS